MLTTSFYHCAVQSTKALLASTGSDCGRGCGGCGGCDDDDDDGDDDDDDDDEVSYILTMLHHQAVPVAPRLQKPSRSPPPPPPLRIANRTDIPPNDA